MAEGISIKFRPPDLPDRLKQYGFRADVEMKTASDQALKAMEVPPYAPPSSTYIRTGKLGRSLGVTMAGGRPSRADIHEIRRLGRGQYEFSFGSRLAYAPWVIGDKTQSRVMRGKGWWTMSVIYQRSRNGIQGAFDKVSQRMKRFVEGEVWR